MLIRNWIDPTVTEGKSLHMSLYQASAPSSSLVPTPGRSSCQHDPNYKLGSFCGLCWLIPIWEDEAPRRLHAYKLLAENGNPAMDQGFVHYLETGLGLKPPQPGERLDKYRLARGQLYEAPRKSQSPVTFAIWHMMGYQPKLGRPFLRTLCGQEELVTAAELELSVYGVHIANAKAIRYTLRILRS